MAIDKETALNNLRILKARRAAKERGDQAECDRLLSKLEGPAHTLMAIKSVMGADWIRNLNLNTRQAELKYGPNWLDD